MDRSEIFRYVAERYGTQPEYLWSKTPGCAVLRHQGNRKWYGAVLDVSRKKLGLEDDGIVDILDVKCEPEWNYLLRQEPGILPGYHMNKEHWISVLLDGTVSGERVCALIDSSYALTKGK